MKDIVQIAPPPVYAVQVSDVLTQLGIVGITDSGLTASLNTRIGGYIAAMQNKIESHLRRVLITQIWLLKQDSFPGHNLNYQAVGYAQIELPKPPFQSVYFLKYIDTFGDVQTLLIDTTFGTDPQDPQYGYQLDRGSETQPARVLPPFARPWPPTRMVPSNVLCQFRCGYGGPLSIAIAEGSAVVNGATFNPDDAPLLPGDTGLAVLIPGAGPNAGPLITNIASVDGDGIATLGAPAVTAVTSNDPAWFGQQILNGSATGAAAFVPSAISQAIIFLAAQCYEQGSIVGMEIPDFICDLISEYRYLT